MPFTEFYCDFTSGANVNAGDDAGAASMSDTAGTGSYSAVTHQYTSVATIGSVAVGQFLSIYSGAATTPAFIGRITAVTGGGGAVWVITVSTTAISGTEPTTASTYKAKVGGAWKGPNGTENHPFGFVATTLTDAAGDTPRVNLKGGTNYAMTGAITHALAGVRFQGYTTAINDSGKATIDGGTSGASYALLTVSGTNNDLVDLIVQNNGATGSAAGLVVSAGGNFLLRCVVNNVRGHGFSGTTGTNRATECEAYACNQSNTANTAGYNGITIYERCIAHDNAGSNTAGFRINANGGYLITCVSDSNGGKGLLLGTGGTNATVSGCDFYNNASDGIDIQNTAAGSFQIENCNFIKNGGYGINGSGASSRNGVVLNCGFGAGTQVNTSGSTTGLKSMTETGSITYASDVTPWVDPANGDFRLNLAAAKNVGRGGFTQTAASYAGTVSYPDVGAAQHIDSPATVINKTINIWSSEMEF